MTNLLKSMAFRRGAVLAATVFATGSLVAGGHGGAADNVLPQVANAKWQAECAACHTLYHPGLLPARSWQAIIAGLDRHFGENATLDPATRDEIARFLDVNAADRNGNRRSARIVASISATATPLRASETRYLRAKHDELGAAIWRRPAVGSAANCGACHRGASRGDFAERDVAIPSSGAVATAVK